MHATPLTLLRRLAVLPVWRALLALFVGLVGIVLLRLGPGTSNWPLAVWALAAGVLGASAATLLRLGAGWRAFVLLVPSALFWQVGHTLPTWLYLMLLAGLGLVFGGGLLTRVPLYNSNRQAWSTLADLLPQGSGTFVDLGAGLGGPVAHLARMRADWHVVGVEASPLVWLLAWLRCRRSNSQMKLGSLWRENLQGYDVAFVFLSPAPMADLWRKVRNEMASGSLLISHSFEVPGIEPERVLPLSGRPGACLRLYRVP